MDKLEFPLTFVGCPVCKEGRGVVRRIAEEKLPAGEIPEGFHGGMITEMPLIDGADVPKLIGPRKIKVLVYSMDICEICGSLWCSHVGIVEVLGEVQSNAPLVLPDMKRY